MRFSNVASMAAIALLVALVAFPQSSFGQEEELQLFEGELVGVDSEAQTLTVQNAEDTQMTFSYDAQTEVQGAETTIQGLSRQTGMQVRVMYAGEENPAARRIIVLEEQ